MKITKILALVLCLVMAVSLCACGGSGNEETQGTTTAATTEATTEATTQATTEAEDTPAYKVTVVDEAGNPIADAAVQVCNDGGCNFGMTDAEGVALIPVTVYADDYHANLMSMPEGYAYTTEETEFYFASGSNELTITLKAVA